MKQFEAHIYLEAGNIDHAIAALAAHFAGVAAEQHEETKPALVTNVHVGVVNAGTKES